MMEILKRFRGVQKKPDGGSESDIIEDDGSSETPYMISAAFYLVVILVIGLPMWFYTCSVTRYPIPTLDNLEFKLIQSSLKLHLDISIIQLSRGSSSDSNEADDGESRYLRSHLPRVLETSIGNVSYNIDWRVRRPTYEESSTFNTHIRKDVTTNNSDGNSLIELESRLVEIHKKSGKFRLFMYLIREQDHPSFCDRSRTHSYTINTERFIYLCPSSAMSKPNDHSPVVSLIVEALKEVYANTIDQSRVKLILDSRVDLLLTIVPEDMEQSDLVDLVALADKIHHLYDSNVKQKLPELRNLVNFRLITQYFFDLLDKNLLSRLVDNKQTNSTGPESRELSVDRMDLLFRSFEARLDRHSAKNVHDVILLVPKTNRNRIILKDESKRSASSLNYLEDEDNRSLLVANDDKALALGIRAIVRRLAGLSSVNICKSCRVRRDIFFCSWELDAIMGTMTMMKLRSTYASLTAINQQVMGIKIPKEVAATVREAHDLALQSIDYLTTQRPHEAYTSASRAYELSESAFYNPSLLESLYFPDDLKYAIYLPFFLPLAYPIFLSFVKLLKYSTAQLLGGNQRQKLKVN